MNALVASGTSQTEMIWMGVGFFAQTMFFMRFLIQWIVSEIKKQSVIPVAFWFFSIVGASGLLAYSIYRKDPVFILGQSIGLIVYFRNIALIFGNKKTAINKVID